MARQRAAGTIDAEDVLADRIRMERKARGWSYERLAALMAEAGCPIHPTALTKIEQGKPRRRIVVNELMALVQVFGGTVDDWLLGADASRVDEGLRAFYEAATALEGVRRETARYVSAVDDARARMSPALRDRITTTRDDTLARLRADVETDERPPVGGWYVGEFSVPLTLAARDVLSDDELLDPVEWSNSTRYADWQTNERNDDD
ncbi:helix-turn-helix domain-containing protein [Clavibacter capsici]|uniref:helix-turn-helix domain-containing protein n=1 Tax=Clavibacter capsici TaxID=1874630 RepID=UPI0006B226D9|nr:helix-turn-helix transcriptional regulator [Clavibacter capsici]